MPDGIQLAKYSIGVGDRFAHQAVPQLRACVLAAQLGAEVIPVWNKSNREHAIVGSEPASVRAAADQAVRELGWKRSYHVDADHINFTNVDRFVTASDFFTLDVADAIGRPADPQAFLARHPELMGRIGIAGIDQPFETTKESVTGVAAKYLFAVQEAGRLYRHIEERKGRGKFITEVSMDETDCPQTPSELLIILAALADEGIPLQTIAPKFTGRFNKGVDYVGDPAQFEREFRGDICVVAHAVARYGLPANLKLSIHSGSDKFSIYPAVRHALRDFDAGVHLKTAGTTWLEELIGLAEAGGDGLELAKEVYAEAYAHRDELCAPYAAVIDINPAKLPAPAEVNRWTGNQYVTALRHQPHRAGFNLDLRQLLHVGYKVAAKMGSRYLEALERHEGSVSANVTENILERHLKPVFV